MDIDKRFEPKPFDDLEPGALFVGFIGEQRSVRAIKAYVPTEAGAQDDYFVTVGPFDEDYGQFPVLHYQNALYDKPVLELKGGYQISPSFAPEDIMGDPPSVNAGHGVLLFLDQNRVLMGVAEIGHSGQVNRRWLDVKTGEILPLLRHADFIVTRRWRLTEPVENAAPKTIFEFNAETESA